MQTVLMTEILIKDEDLTGLKGQVVLLTGKSTKPFLCSTQTHLGSKTIDKPLTITTPQAAPQALASLLWTCSSPKAPSSSMAT